MWHPKAFEDYIIRFHVAISCPRSSPIATTRSDLHGILTLSFSIDVFEQHLTCSYGRKPFTARIAVSERTGQSPKL